MVGKPSDESVNTRLSTVHMKSSKPKFITVGTILGPWGAEGKLKVRAETDIPERFAPHSILYINHQPITIESTDWHNERLVIKLNSVNSVQDALKLRGQSLEILSSQVNPLPEGQYYHFQIIGLEVRTTGGEVLGNIIEILTGQSNDNYLVSGNRGEILIPAIEDIVKSIDITAGCMVIEAITGLLD